MKKIYFLAICFALLAPAFAQDKHDFSSVTGTLIRTTPKLKDIDKNSVYGEPFTITRDENGLVGVVKKTAVVHPTTYESKYSGPDPLTNKHIPNGVTVASATIGANFDGLGFTSVNPSDPNCAVGPNHVIQTINNSSSSYFKIWNKAGTQVQAQLLISSLTGVQGSGDPVVVYDQLANRWLLTEFGRTPASSSFVNTLIMAVSVTDDPTGSWYIYSFVDNTFFVDFPKFSVWHNAYYATSNDFNTGATTYLGSSIYAFERSKMLTGDPTAVGIRTRLTDPSGRYFSMAPVCLEGTTTSSQSGLFAFFQDDQFTASGTDVDSLFIFEFTPDFAVPASSVIGAFTKMATTPFDSDICAVTRDQCVNQQGSAVALESLAGRLTHKVIYRNFGTHESIVANTSVDVTVNLGLTGIRWWELRRPAATWSIYQEGTYSPDANHRWLGGICMDAIGNIGLMYNVSGTTAFPSIRFTGRNSCDPLGTMTLPETVIINGTVANGSTRYGDYNTLAIDPSTNRDFWLTAQYNSAATWSTRLATFRLNDCTPLPKIRFDSSMKAYREADATTSLTTCQNYKDYVVNVVIDAAPSQPAIVTFATSGTATNGSGRDYTITPATVTLDAGNLSRAVTIRVFDDDALEGNESFTISYSVNNSGGNAAADVYNQTCLVNIIDNEAAPVASRTVVQTWGDFNVAATTSGAFNGGAFTDKRLQNIYLASDLIAAGFTPGNITEFAWNFNSATVATFNNFNLDIGFTTAANLTSGFISPAFTNVFSGNYTTPGATGWSNFILPTPITWNGTDNIVVQTCWDNTATSADVSLLGMNTAYNASALVRANTPGPGTTVCASAATNLSAARPGIRLKMISQINPVATVLNTSKTANLGPLDTVYFYDASGRVMAKIKNLTAFDYGCTQIQIDRAGSTSAQFWNNNTANYLASKSFKVIPTNNTATGHYQITLYYTNTEVTGWQTATGLSWGAAQMVKVSNGFFIPDVTTATPHTGDVSLIGTSQLAYGTDNTITGDFNNTGFSGFGVGVPAAPLPVTIVYFNGYQKNNYGILEWRTAAEYNNKGFEVEKSYDGINYFKIGFVDGAGTSSVTNNYLFTDKTKLTNVQYYRLKQIDFDARAVVSNTIVLKSNSREILDLLSVTNPFKTTINMLFTKPLTQSMNIELFDITGKKVFSTTRVPGTLSLIEFSVADKLNRGNYILKVTTGDQQFVKKLVKL